MGALKSYIASTLKTERPAFIPALFLCLAAAPGGLRSAGAWGIFSAALFVYLAFFDKEFSLSGLRAWGLLGIWLLIGLAFSPEPLNSFWYFSRYLALLAFFSSVRGAGEEAKSLWIGAVFLLAGASCLTVLWRAATGQGVGGTFDVSGMVGPNINYSTAFMAAAFAALFALLLDPPPGKRWIRPACIPGLALLGFTIVAVNSRGAFLAVLVSVLFIFFLRRSFRPALYFVLAVLLALVLLPAAQMNWLLKVYDPRALGRFAIWGSAFDAIAARPAFGWGLGLFDRAFELFKFSFPDGVSYYGHSTLHAHSEPLNLAAEAGIPAALLFVWGWAEGVFGGTADDAKTLVLKVFAVSLFVQSSVDVIFYSGAPQVLFFGTMGMLAAGNARRVSPARVKLLALLLICWCSAFVLRFSFDRARAGALDPSLPIPARAAYLKKAAAFAPGDGALLGAAAPLSLAVHGNYAAAAAMAEKAIDGNPKDPFKYFEAARFYVASGDPELAKKLLFQALALEPYFLRARLALALTLADEGDLRSSAREFNKIDLILSGKPSARWVSEYDASLLSFPLEDYGGIRKKALGRTGLKTWKKTPTGGTTALSPKTR